MERLIYIDVLRGIAILSVVLGHVFYYCGYRETILCTSIYSCHMSLFMFISGFCAMWTYKVNTHRELYRYIFKKVRMILLPFIVWSVLVGPISECVISDEYNVSSWWGYYWFLPCLFFLNMCFLLYNILRKKSSSQTYFIDGIIILGIFVILVVLYIVFPNTLTKRTLTYMCPYFLGVLIAKCRGVNTYIKTKKYTMLLGGLLYCIMAYFYHYSSINNMDIYAFMTKIIAGFSMIVVCMHLLQNINLPKWLSKQLQFLGTNTMGIYLIHMLFITKLWFPKDLNYGLAMLLGILVSIFITYFCVGLINIVRKNKYLSLLLLGKI